MTNRITNKQKKVAKAVIENASLDNPLNGGQIMVSSGYGTGAIKTPSIVLNSDGVQQELKNLGFTEENAKTVVSEILLNPDTRDNDRLKAAEQVFKVHGSYAPEKRQSLNLNVEITKDNPKAKQLADDFENKFREELLDNA